MKTNVTPWPSAGGRLADPPKRIMRPCDYGLWLKVQDLEQQLGSVEAYNRLVEAAAKLRAKIEAGRAQPQNPLYAVDPKGGNQS